MMDHQQWLEWRRGGVGSSDAAVIMGVSPWKTKYQLWQEKTHGLTQERENASMTRGKELEETARVEFERQMRTSVFAKNCTHGSVPWMRASLDGIDMDGKVMVEIKCPNREDHSLALSKKVPTKYFPQCQHQMMVTELDFMYYFSFNGREGAIVEIKRDPDYIDSLWEEEHKFWSLKESGIPPELCDRDYLDMNKDAAWSVASAEWKYWKEVCDNAEKKKEECRESLIKLSQGKIAQGCGVKLSRQSFEGRLDTKKAVEENPEFPWEKYKGKATERVVIKST